MSQQQSASTKQHTVKKLNFTQGSLLRSMLMFAWPFLLGELIQNLYGTVDLAVVSYFASTSDAAAVSIGSQVMSVPTYLLMGLSVGVTVRIGWHFGAQNTKRLSCATGTAITIFAALALALVAIFLLFHGAMVDMMQTPADAAAKAEEYLLVCGLGIIFIAGYNVLNGVLAGLGNSRTPFLFVLVACGINVVLDIVFVYFFQMGAFGTAIATTVAQAGSFTFALLYIKRKGFGYPLSFKHIKFDKEETKQILKIGSPIAVQYSLIGFATLFIMAIINQLGVAAAAAAGIVGKWQTFLLLPASSMSSSISAAASQNLGANLPQRAKKSLWMGISIALVPSVIVTIVCQFFGVEMLSLMSSDPLVLSLGATYLRSYVFDVILSCFVFCLNGYFCSHGKSWFSLLRSIVTAVVLRIPLAWLLAQIPTGDLYIIGFASPISNVASIIMCLAFYFYLERKMQNKSTLQAAEQKI